MSLRRPTVALLSFTFDISPLCDVAQTSDCGTHCYLSSIISPLCGVALMPDCGICYSFCILSRSHSDTRLALSITLGFREDYRPTSLLYFPCTVILLSECALLICSYASCLHLLYLMSKLSCEYFHSTHLACWFGQMLTKAISWMKGLIVSRRLEESQSVPCDPGYWSLVLYTLPLPK